MSTRIKVIHLEMEGEHYYFGSLKAMYDTIGRERMGMKYNSFHSNVRVLPGKPYTNRRKGYTIRMGFLVHTKTNRFGGFMLRRAEAEAAAKQAASKENPAPTKKTDKPQPMQLDLFG